MDLENSDGITCLTTGVFCEVAAAVLPFLISVGAEASETRSYLLMALMLSNLPCFRFLFSLLSGVSSE